VLCPRIFVRGKKGEDSPGVIERVSEFLLCARFLF
jgi:hypothetical protein